MGRVPRADRLDSRNGPASPGYLAVPLAETPSLELVGYVDRQTITIEYRSAGGNFELLEDLATELVKLNDSQLADRALLGPNDASASSRPGDRVVRLIGVGNPRSSARIRRVGDAFQRPRLP